MPETKIQVVRYHDFSAGHRVVGHEGKCRNLHGHNYRVYFYVAANLSKLDAVGRVVDFGVIKDLLCGWLEDQWDHRMLIWLLDPLGPALERLDPTLVLVPFNPTAENMGKYLLEEVGPSLLADGLVLTKVVVEETRKCSVTVERG